MKIAASTNPPIEGELLNYLSKLNNLGVDYIHADVMDGVLVEAKTFDEDFLQQIRQVSDLPIDVHLMVYDPQIQYKKYIQKGVDCIAVHLECFKNASDLVTVLKDIKSNGIKASLAIQIETRVEKILPFIEFCDRVLVMSVKIGKSGQLFNPKALQKIGKIYKYINDNGLKTEIEVDGGVTLENASKLIELGVTTVVVGGYLYTSSNKPQIVIELKNP